MSDEELDRRLREARPPTAADDGWAATSSGDDVLREVLASAGPRVARLRRPGRVGATVLAAAAVAAVLVAGVGSGPRDTAPQTTRETGPDAGAAGPMLPGVRSLVSYDTCAAAAIGLRAQAARSIEAYRSAPIAYFQSGRAALQSAGSALGAGKVAPDHSGTNNQERGIDEPDVVKTDGTRLISVSGGVLRVTDVATRKTTGSLDLSMYAGAQDAQLLVDGDRALVVLGDDAIRRYTTDFSGVAPTASTYVLVDLAPVQPMIVSTFRPRGRFVDARLVNGLVRLVVSSAPTLVSAERERGISKAQRLAAWRSAVARAPVSAWLPNWTITTGTATTTGRARCTALEHPARYTGARLTTVYTVDLASGFANLRPTTLAADGATVYATARNLYLTSQGGSCPAFASCAARSTGTEIHRFDIAGTSEPVYRGSGSVAGNVLDSYSLSQYRDLLRVVTTVGFGRSTSTSVLALDADDLTTRGTVGGLGRGEQVYGVRFAGPLAYLVTFRQTDPLYVVDLTDPAKPVAAGRLKITGFSDYLHLVGPGRVLGVGSEASTDGESTGAQVSLFDVDDPARPTRVDRVFRKDADTSDVADPHAFQYWAPTRTAFVPLREWNRYDGRSRLLVLRVGADSLRTVGEIANPTVPAREGYDAGVVRAVVIGGSVWTLSAAGLQVSSLTDLARQAWIAF